MSIYWHHDISHEGSNCRKVLISTVDDSIFCGDDFHKQA